MLTEVRRAFPDFYGKNVIQIAEGDLVLNRTVLHGTHLGEFQGLIPNPVIYFRA
jgi:predicted ester cyclase